MAVVVLSILSMTPVQAETLKEVILKTLKGNPEVLAAVANKDASGQEIEQARAAYLPTLDVRVAGGREWSKSSSTDNTETPTMESRTLNRSEQIVTARQLIFDGGITLGEVARQQARHKSLSHRVNDTSDNVGQRTADVYLDVIKNQELFKLAQQNLKIHQDYLGKMQERVKSGVGQRADLQLAEGREALAATTLTNREAGLEDARIRYKRLVGELPQSQVMPDPVTKALPHILELAVEIAFANNASLAVARADVEAAREQEGSAKARYMPSVSLEVGTTRNRNLDGTPGPNYDTTGMVVMNFNLFRGGADKARIQETASRITAALETQNNTQRTIEEEVGRAWVAMNAAKASIKYLEEHALRTEEVKQAYQTQFDIGRRTMLDLMNAENELFQARSALVNGRFTLVQSEYRLLAAMGGLLKVIGIEKN